MPELLYSIEDRVFLARDTPVSVVWELNNDAPDALIGLGEREENVWENKTDGIVHVCWSGQVCTRVRVLGLICHRASVRVMKENRRSY